MTSKVEVNKDNCVGCGCCEGSFPEVFELVDGIAVVKAQPNTDVVTEDICPTGAVEVKEEEE